MGGWIKRAFMEEVPQRCKMFKLNIRHDASIVPPKVQGYDVMTEFVSLLRCFRKGNSFLC